jgi:hypothetical protein
MAVPVWRGGSDRSIAASSRASRWGSEAVVTTAHALSMALRDRVVMGPPLAATSLRMGSGVSSARRVSQ